jgi:hypothetical protein
MRFQHFDIIDTGKLGHYAARFHSPRITCAVKKGNQYVEKRERGTLHCERKAPSHLPETRATPAAK